MAMMRSSWIRAVQLPAVLLVVSSFNTESYIETSVVARASAEREPAGARELSLRRVGRSSSCATYPRILLPARRG
ncbi:hypothetical protein K466DRAFT_235119 [Polyporus arcularius HHB13444]|uniref:Secreted protein n=1 Tax=Polyporus arcularius HHB13444 TaxID=1314778 RepID=A0A5C3P6A3_9APHY|nr:hypothetical protein K466DRAFT_235119 [Polyporus arcularius HHB13444]